MDGDSHKNISEGGVRYPSLLLSLDLVKVLKTVGQLAAALGRLVLGGSPLRTIAPHLSDRADAHARKRDKGREESDVQSIDMFLCGRVAFQYLSLCAVTFVYLRW